jgi:Uncharacterised nucleotidyltransferase
LPSCNGLSLPESLWPALSALAGQPWPPVSEAGVAAFVRAADTHRLIAIAAHAGSLPASLPASVPDSLPASLRAAIANRYMEIAEAEATNDRDVDELLARLPCRSTGEWLGVNGADYRRRLYPSTQLRPMRDIDLLVRAENTAALAAQFVAAGFTVRPPVPGNPDISLDPPARAGRPWRLWVDLYPGLVDRSRADIDYDEIWRSREYGPDGMPRMARRHALAAHALMLANMQLVTHLRKLLDLWLLSRDEEAVRGAIDCARQWNIRRSLYVAFAAMRRVFPETTVDLGGLLDASERAPLDRLVARGAPFTAFPPRPIQIWRKLSLLDSPGIRIRFAAAHARKIVRRLSGASSTFSAGLDD